MSNSHQAEEWSDLKDFFDSDDEHSRTGRRRSISALKVDRAYLLSYSLSIATIALIFLAMYISLVLFRYSMNKECGTYRRWSYPILPITGARASNELDRGRCAWVELFGYAAWIIMVSLLCAAYIVKMRANQA